MRRALLGLVTIIAVLVVAALLILGVLWLITPAPRDVPEIRLYVNDLASPGALSPEDEFWLTELCLQIDNRTSAEVAILVVNKTDPMTIDEFAFRTFERNGIGKVGKDNGLLIVVATDENRWRIEVGYGLEGTLPDGLVGRFAREYLEPALAVYDYYGGLFDVTYAMGTEILNNYDASAPTQPKPWVIDWGMVAIVLVVAIVLGVLTKGRIFLFIPELLTRGRFGGGRSGGGGASGR